MTHPSSSQFVERFAPCISVTAMIMTLIIAVTISARLALILAH